MNANLIEDAFYDAYGPRWVSTIYAPVNEYKVMLELEPLLERISERERTVLRLRFGDDLTQAEIGERIGVSQMQVSRLIRQALVRLRDSI